MDYGHLSSQEDHGKLKLRLRRRSAAQPSSNCRMLAMSLTLIQPRCYACTLHYPICREAIPMTSMRRDDVIWTVVVTLIAVTINPILKVLGLLPADVFQNLGISFPGQPQIVFGPLMAFLLLALFLKTGKAMVFPVIGFLRALSLSFVFPANVEHSGTLLAAIVACRSAALLLNNLPGARAPVLVLLLARLFSRAFPPVNLFGTGGVGSGGPTPVGPG